MPIYEYRCQECDESFEVFVRSSSQQTDLTCPKCGSQKVKKPYRYLALAERGEARHRLYPAHLAALPER
jgi:putative FmdB family regulatory protein